MTKAPKINPDGYVHARNAKEYQRLKEQARQWSRATERTLDAIGLGPGMHCLDVGCGPGAVMRLMADRVGPKGLVTGIDADATLGAQALAELEAQGGAQFSFVAGDVLELEAVPGAPFDLCFCRLLLMHMDAPVAVLAKMRSWTRTGGFVVAQELDFGSFAIEPETPALEAFRRVLEGVYAAHRRDLQAGRHLPAQFEAAGLGLPDETHANSGFVKLADMAEMLIAVYDGLLPAAEALGLANGRSAKVFRAEMRKAAADPRVYCGTPTLITAWKQVG